jgi:hypothetical protein
MATNIILKKSSVTGRVPSAGDLEYGELALNYADGRLYYKTALNAINSFGSVETGEVNNVYYVAKNGSDSNNGKSLARPFATIDRALIVAAEQRAQYPFPAGEGITIFLKSGNHYVNNPVVLPAKTAIMGDNLRTTSIIPNNRTRDVIRVNNGSYINGVTFRNHLKGKTSEELADNGGYASAAVSFDPNAGTIVLSPYVQNCTSYTAPDLSNGYMVAGTGMRIDGSLVKGNIRSMVVDAFTQINENGYGIHIINGGYAQLVSVFTVCCDVAVFCENGGQCSITNSNSSFGNYALKATGLLPRTLLGDDDTQQMGKIVGAQTSGRIFKITGLPTQPRIAVNDALSFDSLPNQYYSIFKVTPVENAQFSYNVDKCRRDTKLIVDSIALDVLYGTNSESIFAGLQYWNQNNYVGTINTEITQTVAAIEYVKDRAKSIALSSGNQELQTIVNTRFDNILTILNSGVAGITDQIVSNGLATTDVTTNNVYTTLLANKNSIAADTIAWINTTYPGFTYNQTTCARDVGYIIDSVAFDLLHGGNKQSIKSGVYYYSYAGSTTRVPGEMSQVSGAYNFIKTIIDKVIKSQQITGNYQNLVSQVTGLTPATSTQTTELINRLELITDIINQGPGIVTAKIPMNLSRSSDPNDLRAFNNLTANRDFIAAETIAFIDSQFDTFNVELDELVNATIPDNTIVRIWRRSLITSSGHTFEYVGAGTDMLNTRNDIPGGALPSDGGVPIQENEIVEESGGKIYFTSTDHKGDFRIGGELVINRASGTIEGDTFDKSLFAVLTPYILALEG